MSSETLSDFLEFFVGYHGYTDWLRAKIIGMGSADSARNSHTGVLFMCLKKKSVWVHVHSEGTGDIRYLPHYALPRFLESRPLIEPFS